MLRNKAEFNFGDLVVLFGEERIINIDDGFASTGVSTDTRTLEKDNIFVALEGEKFDAHDLVNEAFEKGASAAVVNEKKAGNYSKDKKLIKVKDSLDTLGDMAGYHRNRFEIPVIAVGGSNGKTTTKDMIASILSQRFNTFKTYSNYNNRVGVPLMLFRINENHEAAVIEIATNQPGEISMLSEMTNPTHGVITNISKEHLEQLMDIRGVELEETFLFGKLKKNGFALINIDDNILQKYAQILERAFTFGRDPKANIYGEVDYDDELKPAISLKLMDRKINVKPDVIGLPSALNAIAAAATAYAVEPDVDMVKDGLEAYKNDEMTKYGRMRLDEKAGIRFINDCYNANPASMRLALETLGSFTYVKKRIAVLGDMLELGDHSFDEHINLIKYAAQKVTLLILHGQEFKDALSYIEPDKNIIHLDNKSTIVNYIVSYATPADMILVKGSRGMQMEEIIQECEKVLGG